MPKQKQQVDMVITIETMRHEFSLHLPVTFSMAKYKGSQICTFYTFGKARDAHLVLYRCKAVKVTEVNVAVT